MEPNPCTSDFAPRTSPYAMPARALFQKVASLGFESVQLAFSSVEECSFAVTDHIEIPEAVSPAAIEAILEASGETGVAIGAVNGTWNMAHPDSEVRAEGLRRMEGFLAAAKPLGCPIATLCSGTRSLISGTQATETARMRLGTTCSPACAARHCGFRLYVRQSSPGRPCRRPDAARRGKRG